MRDPQLDPHVGVVHIECNVTSYNLHDSPEEDQRGEDDKDLTFTKLPNIVFFKPIFMPS